MSMAVIAVACFLISRTRAVPQHETVVASKHETVSPKWRTDLRSVIGSAPLGVVYGRAREYKALPRTSLWFTDNKTIVATFVTRAGKPSLSSREGSDTTLSLRLRPVFLDATTGKVVANPDWPSDDRNASIIAVHEGRFVTQVRNELTLYASDLQPLKNFETTVKDGTRLGRTSSDYWEKYSVSSTGPQNGFVAMARNGHLASTPLMGRYPERRRGRRGRQDSHDHLHMVP